MSNIYEREQLRNERRRNAKKQQFHPEYIRGWNDGMATMAKFMLWMVVILVVLCILSGFLIGVYVYD